VIVEEIDDTAEREAAAAAARAADRSARIEAEAKQAAVAAKVRPQLGHRVPVPRGLLYHY
jgi:hypothetical protein